MGNWRPPRYIETKRFLSLKRYSFMFSFALISCHFVSKCMQKCTVYGFTWNYHSTSKYFSPGSCIINWTMSTGYDASLDEVKAMILLYCACPAPRGIFTIKMKPAQNLSSLSKRCQVVLKKTQLPIPLVLSVSTDKCKQFLFQGQWATMCGDRPKRAPRFLSPGFSFLGGKKPRFWVATPFCPPFFLSGWVMQSKHCAFCPPTLAAPPIIAYQRAKSWP